LEKLAIRSSPALRQAATQLSAEAKITTV
jgi:hypothetical protein